MLRALPELPDATLTLHGPMLTDADRAHRPRARARSRDELGVRDRVTFGDEIAYAEVPHLFGLADARRQRDARQRGGQGRVRGRRRVPAGVRGLAGVRRAAAGAAPLPRRLSRLARGEDPRLRRRRRAGAARARRRGALGRATGPTACSRSPAHEAARALRLARAVPAAARRRAEAEVGRGRRGRRPPRARGRAGGLADARRALPSRRPGAPARARRRAVLPAAAVADRARAARLPAGRGARAGHARDGRVPPRAPARRLAARR